MNRLHYGRPDLLEMTPPRLLLLLCAIGMLSVPACGPKDESRETMMRDRHEALAARRGAANMESGPIPVSRVKGGVSSRVLAQVNPVGSIPYDNQTLPIVSPDGRFVATQTGTPPEWDSVFARPGAAPPTTSRIEIYELPYTGVGTAPPRRHVIVDEAALLGRSCDDTGFLIEAPQVDGSRWIGKVAWRTGNVRWLVSDRQRVSAFPALGPGGRLAWSSRLVGSEEPFELHVRRGEREFRIPAAQADWLMPTWSCAGAGDGLFAMLLGPGGTLDAVFMDAISSGDAQRSMQRLALVTEGAGIDTAYQAVSATVAVVGPQPSHDQLMFYHPHQVRAAMWRPPGRPLMADENSLAVIADGDDFLLVSTTEEIVRRGIFNALLRTKLMKGIQLARPTTSSRRPYLLIQPSNGTIGLTEMHLLTPEQIDEMAAAEG